MREFCEDCGKSANYGTCEERKRRWCAGCGKAHNAICLKRQKMCEACGVNPTTQSKRVHGLLTRWCNSCGPLHAMAELTGRPAAEIKAEDAEFEAKADEVAKRARQEHEDDRAARSTREATKRRIETVQVKLEDGEEVAMPLAGQGHC